MENMVDIMLNPEKYGYKQCPHCNGYGSSLKDPDGVDTCTMCHGLGLIREEKEEVSVS
jgi:DnaJ-class molecular chaperone